MPTYRFIGGPCDGKTISQAAALKDNAQLKCGGGIYEFNAGNPGVVIFLDIGPAGGGTGPIVSTNQVGRAWHKLTHALSVDSAQAIRKSRAGRSRAKRVVR